MTDELCQAHLLGYPHCDGQAVGHAIRVWTGPGVADEATVRLCRCCHERFTNDTDGRAA